MLTEGGRKPSPDRGETNESKSTTSKPWPNANGWRLARRCVLFVPVEAVEAARRLSREFHQAHRALDLHVLGDQVRFTSVFRATKPSRPTSSKGRGLHHRTRRPAPRPVPVEPVEPVAPAAVEPERPRNSP
jgi:hypothetical protein